MLLALLIPLTWGEVCDDEDEAAGADAAAGAAGAAAEKVADAGD